MNPEWIGPWHLPLSRKSCWLCSPACPCSCLALRIRSCNQYRYLLFVSMRVHRVPCANTRDSEPTSYGLICLLVHMAYRRITNVPLSSVAVIEPDFEVTTYRYR